MRKENANGYIKYHVEDDEMIIDELVTYEHGKGYARELITPVIAEAEENENELSLCAYPIDDTVELGYLVSVYEHFGFIEDYNDGNTALMHYEF